MKKTLYVISTLIIMLLLSGCTSTLRQRLQEADACMESCPDSALYILDSIDISTVTNEYDRALYKLLLTQAREKNYYFEKGDSIISESVKYFEQHDEKGLSMKAHYYKGAVNLNAGNLTTALRENLEALGIAREIADTLFMARAHDAIADAYHDLYNLEISIMHRKKASVYFKKTNYESSMMYCLLDIAREYGSSGQHYKAIDLLDSINENFNTTDSVFKGFLLESYIQPLIKAGKYSEALEKYQKSKQFWNPAAYNMQNYPEIAVIFVKCNMPDSARHYLVLESMTNMDYKKNAWYYLAEYELYNYCNRPDSALKRLEAQMNIQNETVRNVLKNEAAFAERDFYTYRANIEKEKSHKYRKTLSYITVLFVLAIIVFYLFYKEKIKRKRIEVENTMSQAIELKQEILKHEIKTKAQSLLIKRLFKSHFITLNTLANNYFEKKDSDKLRKTIISDFEKEIMKMRQHEAMVELQSIVNECHGNIIIRLKNQMSKFKEKDFDFLTLIIAGFSPRAVCLFTDITLGNYYNKWTRLRTRIYNSQVPDKDYFLESLAH